MRSDMPRWLARLHRCAHRGLDPHLRRDIVLVGEEAVPWLIACLDDPEWGSTRVPARAVELLGDLRSVQAVPHLVELLAEEAGGLDL